MKNNKKDLYAQNVKNMDSFAYDIIVNMFDHTDENGILFLQEWEEKNFGIEDEPVIYYECVKDWDSDDLKQALTDFEMIYENIKTIAGYWDEIESSSVDKVLSEDTFKFWNKYLRTLEIDSIDMIQIKDIQDRYELIAEIDSIRNKKNANIALLIGETYLLDEYKDVSVSVDEQKIFDKYKK